MKKYLEIVSKAETITVKEFLERKIYVDPRFQRKACWKPPQNHKYFNSLVRGYALNPIIHADAHSCEEYCSLNELSSELGDFRHVIDSYNAEKISVDGQNRGNAIIAYKNNKFKSKCFSDDGKSKFYKDLSPKEKDKFNNLKLLVVDITESTYSQLTEIFVAVNSGLPLNRMELRNARNTPIARFVRELADKYSFIVDRVESVTTSRMKDLDTVLKTACFQHSKIMGHGSLTSGQQDLSFSDNALDLFYDHGLGQGLRNIEYYGDTFKNDVHNMMEWLDKVLDCAGIDEKSDKPYKVTMPFYWALCSIYRSMYVDNELPNLLKYCDETGNPHMAVYIAVSNVHNTLTQRSHTEYGKKLKNNPKEKKGNYYCYFSTDVKDEDKRRKVKEAMLPNIKDYASKKRSSNQTHLSNRGRAFKA